jgi:methylphosphotriester-DNA--protein-cysteine methyltransferase
MMAPPPPKRDITEQKEHKAIVDDATNLLNKPMGETDLLSIDAKEESVNVNYQQQQMQKQVQVQVQQQQQQFRRSEELVISLLL